MRTVGDGHDERNVFTYTTLDDQISRLLCAGHIIW